MGQERVGVDLAESERRLFGPYRLEELIGRGGMGEVYRAFDTQRDRVVALKILAPAMAADPHFEARFRQESRLVARLSAPHIIPIHDFGEIDGRLFLDMRLVRGVDLATVLQSGALTPHRSVEMLSQIASALDAAHADGLVHRDVKPSNVLYVGDPRVRAPVADEADFAYLVDFGIARSLDPTENSTLTATGHAVGTLGYMAPERFTGEQADRRVDVYALACTLYEALTGRPAFPGDVLAPLMYAHLQRMPTRASAVNRAVPRSLDEVVTTGLAKRPDDRFGTAGHLAEAARSALRDGPPRTGSVRSRPAPTRPGLTAPLLPDPAQPLRAPGPFRKVPPDPSRSQALSRDPKPDPIGSGAPAGRRRALQIGVAAAAAAALIAGAVVGVNALTGRPGAAQAGGLASCGTSPLTCNEAPSDALVAGGQVTMAVGEDITNWNVVSPDGSLGPGLWAMGSVLPYAFSVAPDYRATLNTDLLTSAEQTAPNTVVYTIRPGAVWNDGTPVGAADFAFNWRVRNGRDCPGCRSDPAGYQKITAVTGTPTSGGGSAVTVTFSTPEPDWRALFASTSPLYPAHVAARQGDLTTPKGLEAAFDWFGATKPDYSAGPMVVQDWQPGRAVTLARNPTWYGRPARLDRVLLTVTTDPAAQVSALRDGLVQAIAPTAQSGLLTQLADTAGVDVYASPGLGWERLDVNLRNPALAAPALRKALFTAIDLERMRTIGAAVYGRAEPMGSHNFVPGQPGFTDVLAGSGQGGGDVEAARRILTAAGYTGIGSALVAPNGSSVPPLRAVYPSYSPVRKQVAEYLADVAGPLGLTITPSPTDTIASTLGSGGFDLMLYGWAIPPAQVTDAVQSWSTGGDANYSGYSNPEVDQLLAAAGSNPDSAAAHALLNQADQLLTADAVVLPLYRRPSLLAIRRDVANLRDNPTVGPLYNVGEWGVRAE